MKFLHTADWQLGMKAAHVGEVGARVREERLLATRRVVETAQAHSAQFILVAGDTFEDNGVDRVLVQKAADILAGSNIPVFIIPGNHDPFTPGSVWEHPAWKSAGNVQVLYEEQPVKVPGGFLYPCPIREKHSGKDSTAWIHAGEAHGIKLGMAHGTVEGVQQGEIDYPIPRNAALRTGLDYLALGHWHSTAIYPGGDGVAHMAYSGTHETTKFGERDSGNVLIVDIPSAGAAPVITTVHTGGLTWRALDADIRDRGDLKRLREEIEDIENPPSVLIELCIRGLLSAEDRGEFVHIGEILNSRFLYNHVDTPCVHPSPEDESWVASLPPGVIREAGARLRELADPGFSGERPVGASAEVASRALMELYALVTGMLP
jgi:DNA repair exonuclease